MTVEELIEELKDEPQDLPVYVAIGEDIQPLVYVVELGTQVILDAEEDE